MLMDDLGNKNYRRSVRSIDEDEQDRAVRLGALSRVYQQADRVLTQDPIEVHVVNDSEKTHAWSDGKDIYINAHHIEDFDIDELIQINGLNYHELAHLFYTPRKGSELVKWIIEQNHMNRDDLHLQAFNILEDARAETLFVARYPSVTPYLTKTIVRWMMEHPEVLSSNYLSVRGRRYLPVEMRTVFRDMFALPELIPSINDIVDQYRLLAFPRDYATARVLIKRFVDEVVSKLPLPPSGGGGCTHRDPITRGRPEPGKMQIADVQRATGQGTPEPEFVSKAPQDAEDTEGKQEGGSSGAGTQVLEADDNDTGDRIQDQVRPTYGRGYDKSTGKLPNNVQELLTNIENDIACRKDVVRDVRSKQRVIVGGDGKYQDKIPRGKFAEVQAPLSVIAAARRFARELRILKQNEEPEWEREVSSGKINVQRVIRGCELNEAFDRWDEGDEGTDIEAVVLVDRSGSMGSDSNDMRASEAIWVIKSALQQIDCPVTVYAFDDRTEIVYDKTSKVNKVTLPYIYGNGGTDPSASLISTERLLMSSQHKQKLMFMITDGEFSEANDKVIERMNARGILTVMVLIAGSDRQIDYVNSSKTRSDSYRHKCSIFGMMRTAEDLIPFARKIVLSMVKGKTR